MSRVRDRGTNELRVPKGPMLETWTHEGPPRSLRVDSAETQLAPS